MLKFLIDERKVENIHLWLYLKGHKGVLGESG